MGGHRRGVHAQHGIVLVLTLPMWALSGLAASHSVHNGAKISIAHDDYYVDDVIAWARFPQGLPPELRDKTFERPDWVRPLRGRSEAEVLDEGQPVRLRKKYE